MTTIKRWYCKLWHTSIMFGGGATYKCAHCGEEYACPWASKVK